MKKGKILTCVGLLLLAILVLMSSGCNEVDTTKGKLEEYHYQETEEVTNYVKIVTQDDQVILLELYPNLAPITVLNFQKLVKEHFYDGLTFHRVIANFMIQTGDPTGTGLGGSEEKIKGEFSNNGITNSIHHEKGVVSMARANKDMNSASSQFFICVSDEVSYLDGNYAAFGKVIAGYETVEKISKVKTDENDKPLNKKYMKTVRFVEVNK